MSCRRSMAENHCYCCYRAAKSNLLSTLSFQLNIQINLLKFIPVYILLNAYCYRFHMWSKHNVTGVLIKRWPCENRFTPGECHVTTKAKIEVTWLQAKEHQRWLANHQKLETDKEGFLQVSERESMAMPTRGVWTSSLWNYKTTRFCCFKPPNLWYFITIALGK